MKKVRAILYIFFISILTIPSFGQSEENKDTTQLPPLGTYKGLLWEISGNGLKKPSYLYGTMHVSKKVAFHLTDTFFVALKSADIVALETNPENWMEKLFGSDLFKDMMLSFDHSSHNAINDLYGKAFYIAESKERNYKSALRDQNNVANHMLFRFSEFNGGADYEENTYLDMFIFQTAKKYKKKVTSLEDLQKAVEFMIRSRVEKPEDDEEKEDLPYYDWRESGKSMNELMEESYRKGDLNTLDSLSRFSGNQSSMFHKYMIIERNKIMANSIDSLVKSGKIAFNGIGAAHLPGEEGVIELLRQKGYSMRPVSTHTSSLANKEKKKIEKTYVKEPYHTQKTVDGVITTKSPGKLHLIPFDKNTELYLYPEMANGVYYSLYRIKHHEFIQGQDMHYMYKKIDSLLYENVPGSIIDKDEITVQGYPAVHIKNKSRRGDYQEHRIIYTPMETIVLKVVGTGNYLKKNNADEFFDAFTYTPNKLVPNFTPVSGGFSVSVPGDALLDSKWDDKKNDNIRDFQITAYDKATKNSFYVMKSSYYDYSYLEEDTFELNMFAYKFSKEYEYKIIERKHLTVGKQPAADFIFEKDDVGTVYARFIKSGPTYYMLMQYAPNKVKNTTFFDSFKILPYKYDATPRTVTDTILSYQVQTVGEYPNYAEILNKYPFLKEMYEKELSKNNEYNELDRHFDYFYPKTGESISLDIYRESKYSKRSTDDRLKPIDEVEGYKTYIILKDSISFSEDSSVYYSFIALGDTNSNRTIWETYIEKGTMSYTISANMDKELGPSDYVKTYFSSFSPLPDTTIGGSMYTDKRAIFYDEILHGDSTTVANAIDGMTYVKFEEEDFNKLLMLKDSVNLDDNELKQELIDNIFREISYIKSDIVIDYFVDQYQTYEDSTTLQLKILKSLANNESKYAYETIKKLLMANPPLTDDQWELNSFFYSLNDSLELAATLYPEFLELNRYPEYEMKMYELLVELLDSNKVDPTIHSKYEREILLRANNELKRELNNEEKNSSSDDSYEEDYYSFDSWDEFEGISYSYNSNTAEDVNEKLMTYTKLLIPFYKENQKVRDYFDKLGKLENKGSQMAFEALKLKNDLPYVDTLWNHLAKEPRMIPAIYNTLDELNRLDLLDSTYKTQESMVNAFLATKINMDEDSSVFIKKVLVELPQADTGYVYFFKYKKEESNKWTLYYTGIQPQDISKVLDNNDYSATSSLSKKDDIEEEINDILFNLKLEGRMRVSNDMDYYYDYYDY